MNKILIFPLIICCIPFKARAQTIQGISNHDLAVMEYFVCDSLDKRYRVDGIINVLRNEIKKSIDYSGKLGSTTNSPSSNNFVNQMIIDIENLTEISLADNMSLKVYSKSINEQCPRHSNMLLE